MCAICAGARIAHGTWYAPAVAASLWWTVYCAIAAWALEIDIRVMGMWVITGMMFSLCAGSFFAGLRETERKRDRAEMLLARIRKMQWFAIATNMLAFLGIAYYAIYGLKVFDLTFDMAGLLRLGSAWSAARYENGEPEPMVARVLFTWLYPAALSSGMLLVASRDRWRQYLCTTPIFLAVLVSLVEATRAGLMFAGGAWIAGYIGTRLATDTVLPSLFTRSFVIRFALAGVMGVVFFMAVDVFRGGLAEDKQINTTFDKERFAKYAVGSIPGFTQWFQHYVPETPSFGEWTFAGPANAVGLKSRETGLFTDFVTLSDGEDLNLYTCFRPLILDFTLPGAMLLSFLVGVAMQRVFASLPLGNPAHLIALTAAYVFIISSPITSMFVYNGLLLAFVSTYVVLKFGFPKSETA
jgi:oligosaccharide repeat unit polymerase